MAWFSILPASIAFIEIWVVRFFLVLGIITIGPSVLLVCYDLILYVFRNATYDIPIIGGRARNRPRPRAPSLSERPSGVPRRLTLPGAPAVLGSVENGVKERLNGSGRQKQDFSSDMFGSE